MGKLSGLANSLRNNDMNKFLVKDSDVYVFCSRDPRSDGFKLAVEPVLFEEEVQSGIWRTGQPRESVRVLGVNPANPRHYRYYLELDNLVEDDFQVVQPVHQPYLVTSWNEYLEARSHGERS